jgi:lipopolysaccharide transport system ATP-binding protein
MIAPVLDVTDLGKCFFSYARERHRFMAWMGIHRQMPAEHWALTGVSFRLAPGETVGIIGENAAGKSTLLKLITGTLRPTRGEIQTRGRISAILELGMGFNPEFTGKRNAYHALGLLGLSRRESNDALPEICEFSELGDYFEQPVRTYSSGMQMRLAFAVATARRPDILIVDEALSVGDAYFQHKCMQRIRSFKEAGTTLLFVSHSQEAVRMLCSRGLLLQEGRLVMDADAASVIDFYRATLVKKCEQNAPGETGSKINGMLPGQPGRQKKTVLSRGTLREMNVQLISPGEIIHSGDEVTIHIRASFTQDYPDPHVGIGLRNRLGVIIYEANTYTLGCGPGRCRPMKHSRRRSRSGAIFTRIPMNS